MFHFEIHRDENKILEQLERSIIR